MRFIFNNYKMLLYNNPYLSDIILKSSQGDTIYVHSQILSNNEYFSNLIKDNVKELEIKNFEGHKLLLKCIYSVSIQKIDEKLTFDDIEFLLNNVEKILIVNEKHPIFLMINKFIIENYHKICNDIKLTIILKSVLNSVLSKKLNSRDFYDFITNKIKQEIKTEQDLLSLPYDTFQCFFLFLGIREKLLYLLSNQPNNFELYNKIDPKLLISYFSLEYDEKIMKMMANLYGNKIKYFLSTSIRFLIKQNFPLIIERAFSRIGKDNNPFLVKEESYEITENILKLKKGYFDGFLSKTNSIIINSETYEIQEIKIWNQKEDKVLDFVVPKIYSNIGIAVILNNKIKTTFIKQIKIIDKFDVVESSIIQEKNKKRKLEEK